MRRLVTDSYVKLRGALTPETKDSIDKESLMRLPKGVTLMNMACLEKVLEAEMLEVLSARTDFCYISNAPPENAEEALSWRFRKDQP